MGVKLSIIERLRGDSKECDVDCRAEKLTRAQVPNRRFVYVPGSLPRDSIGHVWAEVRPHETVVLQGEQDVLPPVSLDRVRHRVHAGVPVLHLVSSHILHPEIAAAGA